jgi:ribonucleoside-diphosphate reductase beta chain
MIRYINRDEFTHCILFEKIISEIRKEFPEMVDNDVTIQLFKEAVEQEISWTNHIVGNDVLGITKASTEAYTKYLANKRLTSIGMEPLYKGFNDNPYMHLELIADESGDGNVKSNFFESTVTGYNQASTLDGWDDF